VPTFTRDEILAALQDLARRLADRHTAAEIQIVGGAAIAVRVYERAATQDVDAFFRHNPDAVHEAVREMAFERGWPQDWLNDKATMFAPDHGDPAWEVIVQDGDVVISAAPVDLLLAMKLRSGRGRRDATDIDRLLDACAVETAAEAVAIFDRYFPHDTIADRALLQLNARFD